MIYFIPYDPVLLHATADSTDSGFDSIDQVVQFMGEPMKRGGKYAFYPEGVAFSDFPFRLTTPSASTYAAANREE